MDLDREDFNYFFRLLLLLAIFTFSFIYLLYYGHAVTFPPSDPHTGYHSATGDRGTLNIIWSCLFTMIICVYTTMDSNVRVPWGTPFQHFMEQASYVVAGLIAPELVLGEAANQYFKARAITRRMQHHCDPITSPAPTVIDYKTDGKEHSRAHDLEASANSGDGLQHLEEPTSTELERWTMTHSFFLLMKGFQDETNILGLGKTPIPAGSLISFKENHFLEYQAIVAKLDGIRDEINALSKTNAFFTAIVFGQVIWFSANIVVRLVSNLPVSQLEWVTCGYIVCTSGTYAFAWSKPYNVSKRITLPVNIPCLPTDILSDFASTKWEIITALGAIIFGSFHLATWNYDFFNNIGQPSWRLNAGIITAFPVLYLLLVVGNVESLMKSSLFKNHILKYCSILHCIARLWLGFLVVMSFWSLPVGVYKVTIWSSVVPHVG